MKKIEATHIEEALWEEFEAWTSDRILKKRDWMRAFFRLFLAAPETLKHLALAGRPEQIEAAAVFYADKMSQDIVAFAKRILEERDPSAAAAIDAAAAEAGAREKRRSRGAAPRRSDGRVEPGSGKSA